MRHRSLQAVAILLALAGLAITLRHDLAGLALYQGKARLQAGDLPGADTAFRRAVALGSEAAPLAYNLGVSLYRKGEFAQAQKQFSAALATAAPELGVAIHYNRGNCQFRQGELLAASDPRAAKRLFQEAIADYGKALVLSPGAADARSNLSQARTRLSALGAGLAPDGSQRRAGTDQRQQNETAGGNGAKPGTERTKARPKAAAKGAGQEAGRADAAATSGEPRRSLSRHEAERLLNEARGRAKPAGPPHGGKHVGHLAQPDRDW